jgi:CHAT domain-containing protein
LDLDADLVCLSACETAAGIYVQGEATMSLARAFLVAGARQVVASRWRVADADTHAFMRDLHGLVARGVAPAAALRAVKCAWLARASGVAVWVPFVLWVA